jgi:uncharacterized protein YcfL
MKKIVVALLTVFILTACSAQQTSTQDKAKEAYTIMVKASKEHRELTKIEEKTVDKYDKSHISLKGHDKLTSAVHAMYFNFYETLSGESQHFNHAKTEAEKYMN